MPKVTRLYRHPLKSFTPERLDELHVINGKVRGDRVLAFRFADQGAPDDWQWRRKHNYVVLSNTPEIVLLEVSFNDDSRVLTLKYEGEVFAEGSIDSEEDRFDLSEALGEYVTSLEINPLVNHPERVPLNLIGNGKDGLFHDSEVGGITVYSLESLKAFEAHIGADIDGRRFRSNVVIEGVEAWSELAWSGNVTIGDSEYAVEKLIPRCLATHANPVNGQRDHDIMNSLTEANGMETPTFAVRLIAVDPSAVIRVGDSVEVG
jgi:uncharacterized protein